MTTALFNEVYIDNIKLLPMNLNQRDQQFRGYTKTTSDSLDEMKYDNDIRISRVS